MGHHAVGDAFTLVELLVAICVILILSGLLLASIQTVTRSARKATTTTQILGLHAAMESYFIDQGNRYPPVEADFEIKTSNGIGGPAKTLDLLVSFGDLGWSSDQLGVSNSGGRCLVDKWKRPIRYAADVNMDGMIDRPAPLQTNWNGKAVEPYAYVWSLGVPSDQGDAADAGVANAEHWIYKVTSP